MNTTTAKNNPIGFFDSGVGGLTVYSKFRELLPNEDCLYYGDTIHNPYGEKTKEELIGYARHILDFFKNRSVKAVVIACNTSSAIAYDVVKNDYDFKIYPIIQSCAKVISKLDISKIGIFATNATIKSGAYEREIKKYNPQMEVFSQSCPQWVKFVEDKTKDLPENIEIIKKDLENMLKNNPEKIILGCTHYPYLTDILSNFAPKEIFIDPAEYFVNFVYEDLKNNDLISTSLSKACEEFFVSSNPEQFKNASEMFYKLDKMPKKV